MSDDDRPAAGGARDAEAPRPISEAERKRRQRGRSIALALVLAGLVVVFYALTVVQFGNQIAGSGS